MKKSKFSESQIVNILKEAEAGVLVEDLSRQHGFSKATFYKWKAKYGGKFIRIGLRPLVDRKDRRDLSLFQIGFRIVERKLLNLLPVSPSLCAYL